MFFELGKARFNDVTAQFPLSPYPGLLQLLLHRLHRDSLRPVGRHQDADRRLGQGLGPLDQAETQAYVEHRLGYVGWQGDPGFSDSAFDRIYAHSAGVPRRINTLCDRILLAAFLGTEHEITGEVVDEVAGELQEELGPSRESGERAASPSITQDSLKSTPLLDPDAADRLSQLEDRVSLLEASTSMTTIATAYEPQT